MDITVRDLTQADNTGPLVDEMPRRLPVIVIAFAISVTMLWAGTLLWLLAHMLLFLIA